MALTIGLNGYGIVANCNITTNVDTSGGTWAELGGGTFDGDGNEDVYLFGTESVGNKYAAKSGLTYYTHNATLDFTSGGNAFEQYIYIWVNISAGGALETLANNGLSIIVGNSSTDYRQYQIAGSDDTNGWTGGWKLFVIDPTIAGSVADTGTVDLTTIDVIGLWIDTAVSVRADSIWIDQIAVADGLKITGTSTTAWKDVVDYCTDYTNRAWGMFTENQGIYYAYGKTYIGQTDQTATTSFKDKGRIIQYGASEFWHANVNGWSTTQWESSFPVAGSGVILNDATGFATQYEDGIIVGTDNGRSGTTMIGGILQDVFFDASLLDHASSTVKLYGSNFTRMYGGIRLNDNTGSVYYGGTIAESGQFDPVGASILRNLIFTGTTDTHTTENDGSALLWNSNINIQNCNFIANTHGTVNPHAIQHDTAITTTYTKLFFSGNDFDIDCLASSGTLDITVSGGDTPTYETAGATVDITSGATLELTDLIVGSEVRVYTGTAGASAVEIGGTESVATSTFTMSQSVGGTAGFIVIHKYGYEYIKISLTFSSLDQSIPIQQRVDRNYSNPA